MQPCAFCCARGLQFCCGLCVAVSRGVYRRSTTGVAMQSHSLIRLNSCRPVLPPAIAHDSMCHMRAFNRLIVHVASTSCLRQAGQAVGWRCYGGRGSASKPPGTFVDRHQSSRVASIGGFSVCALRASLLCMPRNVLGCRYNRACLCAA